MGWIAHADDDLSDRWDFKYLVNSLNEAVEVTAFENGLALAQHLGSLKEHQLPDAIFLDLKMPMWDGIKTLKVLKSEPRFTTIPVYMWSSADSKNEMDLCFQLGAEKYIVKPATDEERRAARIALAELLATIDNK